MIKLSIFLTCCSILFTLYEHFFEKAIKSSEEMENINSKEKNASCSFKILMALIFMCITIISVILNDGDGLSIIVISGLIFLLQLSVIGKMWSEDVRYILKNLKRYYIYKESTEGSISASLKTFFAVFVSVIIPATILIFGLLNNYK